jgi:hypothetical protein
MGFCCFYARIDKMANEIYKTFIIHTIDYEEIELSPLKIKYMREFMEAFKDLPTTTTDEEAISVIAECVRVAMKQFRPDLSKNISLIEDSFDLKTLYLVLEHTAGVKLNGQEEDKKSKDPDKDSSSWDDLDLVKLETEAFLLGPWKNFEELETSICMAELMTIISTSRELDYEEKKFLAAMQGVDLDMQSGKEKGQKEWEDMKARVFSGGTATDSNDILALQGQNAVKAGFGIGMGLEYEKI